MGKLIAEILRTLEAEEALGEICVELSSDAFERCDLQLALESRWESSGYKDWMYRVDPADPKIPLRRHVHIAKSKHTSAKSMQASWNDNGTRHDKGSFNTSVGDTAQVREIAKKVLRIPPNVTLESADRARVGGSLVDEVWFSADKKIAYISITVLEDSAR